MLSGASLIMPLSSDQVTALKNPDTKITFQDQNPKKGGSNAWGRYEKYKKCVSIGGATAAGANWQDLSSDFEKGYTKFSTTEDVEMSTSTKRAATEGTPDKEAEQRSRVFPSQVAPLVLVPPVVEPVNKVEMSGATIAALRRMMREEVKLGVDDMEHKVAARLDQSLAPLKEQLCGWRNVCGFWRARSATKSQKESQKMKLTKALWCSEVSVTRSSKKHKTF